MADSSVVVFIIFMVVLLLSAGIVAFQFYNVDKQSKENKELIISKHQELGANLNALTSKLASEISKLEKSSSDGDADLMSRLSVQKTQLETLTTEVNTRIVALEEYDTISKDTFTASAKLLEALSKATQKVADEFDSFRTSQTEFNTDVTTKLTDLSTMDERMDRDIQALKVVEKKVNRLKFDDANSAFYVCGVGGGSEDCKQLAFLDKTPTV
jgi:uncharacterized protein YlxW (UPF0749 family)